LEDDPTRTEQFDSLNNQTSESMKIADQINRMAQDLQKQEMEQAQQQQGRGAQDPKMAVAAERDGARWGYSSRTDAQIKAANAQHAMRTTSDKTAQRLMIDRIKVASKYGSIQP
jgi:hypothetical protein